MNFHHMIKIGGGARKGLRGSKAGYRKIASLTLI